MKHSVIALVAFEAQVCSGFTFHVPTLSGKVYPLSGESSTKVSAIENQIEQATGIVVRQQRITFKGRELKSEKFLADYGIQEGSEVRVVHRLRIYY